MVRFFDDAGATVPLASEVSRIVSLVPSLTEALALSCPEKLVAATDWCTHPADLVVARARDEEPGLGGDWGTGAGPGRCEC